jgi:multidrug efflux system outer membrane protein
MQAAMRDPAVMGRMTPIVASMVLLAGCATLPVAQPHNVHLPDRYTADVARSPGSPHTVAWWDRLNDRHLNSLVTSGLSDSPTIRAARARLEAAEHRARAAGIRFDGDGTLSRTANSDGPEAAAIGLGVTLLPFGGRRSEIALADAQLSQERQGFLETRRAFLETLTLSYVDLRYFEALRTVRRDELRLARSSLEAATGQAEFNGATELEILEARAFVAEVQSELPTIEAQIVAQRRQIATLLGCTDTGCAARLAHHGPQPVPIGISDIGIPADLVRNRPDVREAEAAYEVALADLGVARANRLPRLTLSGDIRSNLPGTTTQSGTVRLSIPVFSQPVLAAEQAAAGARAEAAYLAWKQAIISAVNEVEQSLEGLVFASESLSAAQRSERSLERRAALLREAQTVSSSFTLNEVIDADRALSVGRERTVQSARQLATEYLRLWIALGIVPTEPEDAVDTALTTTDERQTDGS